MERSLWRMVAFLCRYGHQQVPSVMNLTVSEARKMAAAVGELLEAENKSGSRMNEWSAGGGS